jgi:hypothetical protein
MKTDREVLHEACGQDRLHPIPSLRETRSSVKAELAISRRDRVDPALPAGKNDELTLAKVANRRWIGINTQSCVRLPMIIRRVHFFEYLAALAVLS